MSKELLAERDFAGCQIMGARREQQDSYSVRVIEGVADVAESLFLVVADGMGGYLGGREAGLVAVEGCVNGFFEAFSGRGERGEGERLSSAEVSGFLSEALREANVAVGKLIEKDPVNFEQSGTTLVAVVVSSFGVRWVSVGDSPLFLLRGGVLRRLNEDHSMRGILAERVAEGEMSEEEMKTHPERNMLISAVCGEEISIYDLPEEAEVLEKGDILLLASDGVLTLEEGQIASVLEESKGLPASEIVEELLVAVRMVGEPKQDNVTVAVVKW